MGAGTQRWWREVGRHQEACESWLTGQQVQLARMVVRCSRRDLTPMRRHAHALANLIREIRG